MKAPSAKELEVIHADLMVATNILYSDSNAGYSPYMVNLAAYHSAQAIEKSLKALIYANGNIDKATEKELHKTHNFDNLLVRVETCCPNFIQEHDFIAKNSDRFSAFNGMRYGDKSIDKADVYVLLKEAKDLHKELQEIYLKENGQDKKQLHQSAFQQYKQIDKLELDTQNSKYNRKSGEER